MRILVCCAVPLITLSACLRPQAQLDQTQQRAKPEAISLLGRLLYAGPPGGDTAKLDADLAAARSELAADPNDPDKIIWVGRRLGYLWRMNEAVEVFTRGIEQHPDYAPLYRHRGHRFISLRRFDDAIADLERAATLIQDQRDEIEPDGAPNPRNIPLTTTNFNVWYHLGVARFMKVDYAGAINAFRRANTFGRAYKDNIVATADWMYLAHRRLGQDREAAAILDYIDPNWEMIENTAYHRRLLMYKGLISPNDLLNLESASELDLATLGYGLGMWHILAGEQAKGEGILQRVVDGPYWPAFGFIAAEVELARGPG
jgi:tetratricopeptide (TPR) repeat protein